MSGLSISDVAARTGVAEGTLRMWESRYGFPNPAREPNGYRRYDERDVSLVRMVAAERDAGSSIPRAIERALSHTAEPGWSIFAMLRERRPELEPQVYRKRVLIRLSHAIEDESLSRAQRPLMFACFQRERFYRQSEARWREIARASSLAVAFAEFEQLRRPRGGPVEIPFDSDVAFSREWVIVCDAPNYAACLLAFEPPGQEALPDLQRRFEAIWTVEPTAVREAAKICAEYAERKVPGLLEDIGHRLEALPREATGEDIRSAISLSNRMLGYAVTA